MIQPIAYVKKGQVAEGLRIRFVKVSLPNGETEILATSLLDTEQFPTGDFKELYRLRWGVEAYFQVLKSRLCFDNFSGKSVRLLQNFEKSLAHVIEIKPPGS